MAWLMDKLGRGVPQNGNVVGEARIGKSSLLHGVYRQCRERWLCVWLRLVELPEHNAAVFWRALWLGWCEAVGKTAVSHDDARAYYDALDEAIETFSERSGNKRLIFFVDDFDLLVGGIGQRDLDWLRSLVTRYGESLAFVISSTDPLMVLSGKVGGNTAVSPFANLFHNLQLGLLREDAARVLCGQTAAAENTTFSDEDITFLLQEAGAHPDLLKAAMSHLLAAKRVGKHGTPTYDNVAVAVRLDGQVQWLCRQLLARLGEAERAVLVGLVNGRPASDPILVRQLQRKGVVVGERPFADAFRYWVQREMGGEPSVPTQSSTIFKHEPDKRTLYVDERSVHLTKLENRMLGYFVAHANEVCTVEELLENVWGDGKTRSVVEKGVSRLREKIEVDPKKPRYLLSAWGEGYLLRTMA
jgi:hypothetical protein